MYVLCADGSIRHAVHLFLFSTLLLDVTFYGIVCAVRIISGIWYLYFCVSRVCVPTLLHGGRCGCMHNSEHTEAGKFALIFHCLFKEFCVSFIMCVCCLPLLGLLSTSNEIIKLFPCVFRGLPLPFVHVKNVCIVHCWLENHNKILISSSLSFNYFASIKFKLMFTSSSDAMRCAATSP